MNILSIFKKECIHIIRDIRGNILMILFPIVLILILGTALSPLFDSGIDLGYIELVYTDEADPYLSSAYREFRQELSKEFGIEFIATDDAKEAISKIADGGQSSYIYLTDRQEIRLYKNERYAFEANLIEAMTRTFVEKYNLYKELATKVPDKLESAMAMEIPDLVAVKSLDGKRNIASMDYYAITMLTLILLYSASTSAHSVKREQLLKTGNRLLVSPVKKYEIFTGQVLGAISITVLQGLIVLAFSSFILNAYWGDKPHLVIMVIISEAVMAVSIGIGLSYVIKNVATLSGIINTIIPIMVLLGGGYVPFEVLGESIQKISVISPIRWTNQALFRLVYDQDTSYIFIAVAINLAIAAIFIIYASLAYRREDV